MLALSPAAFGQGGPTDCLITGPANAECGVVQFFVAGIPLNQHPFDVIWTLLNDTAGTSFVGASNCLGVNSCPVTLLVTSVGSVTVHAHITTFTGTQKDCEVVLNVVDVTPPSITCPPDANVECGGSLDPAATGTPNASDTCGGVTLSYVDTITGSNCAGPIYSRVWTALDSHGNPATCTQIITTVDTVPPSITCSGPVSVQCYADVPAPDTGSVTTSDNCGATVSVTFVGDSPSNGASNCNNVITRTYQAQDACGNVNTCTQLITVNDNTPPSIICPGPVSVQCYADVPAADIGLVSTSDNCGGSVTVTHAGDSPSNGTSNCNNVITRTYQAQDSCGNVNTCTQLITVNDNTPPSITCSGPVSVQCFGQIPAPDTGSVTTSDNCGGTVSVTHVGDSPSNGGSNCNNVITRTYQAQDSCGNVNTCTQLITVNDNVPPSIACPGPVSVQCFSAVPPPDTSSVTASDNCGFVNVTHVSDSPSNGTSNCNNVITRTYQAMDSCGNVNTCTQLITVNDDTPPTITCSGPIGVQCYASVPAADISSVTASDNCGPVTVTHVGDQASNGTSNCNNVITRTYQAMDSCGNVNTCTQLITVNDNTNPSIACPGPVSVQCYGSVPAPDISLVTASDNCGSVTVTHVSDSPSNGTSNCNNVITRIYKAEDSCGNVNTCTQLITVNDDTNPVLTCPAAVTVTCYSQVPPSDISQVSATDNCGGNVAISFVGDSASNGTANCNVITRTYQGVDGCGNVGTCTQIITVNDNVPPIISCPPNFTLPCGTPTGPNVTGTATATDNCDAPTAIVISFSDTTTGSCSTPTGATISRTWTATDSCNNQSTCVQTITLQPGPGQQGCTQAAVQNLGGGCGITPPVLTASVPTLGAYLSFHLESPTTYSQIIFAAQVAPPVPTIPLTPQCILHVDPTNVSTVLLDYYYTGFAGDWTSRFLLASVPELVDLQIVLQAGVLSQGGPLGFAQLSNAILITLGTCPPYCTFSREEYSDGGVAGFIFDSVWLLTFPAGMDVGIYNPGNGNTAPNGIHWTGDVLGRTSLKSFLATGDGFPSPLPTDAVNSVTTLGTGTLARLNAVLKLNIGFNAFGVIGTPVPGFGALIYINPYATDSLNGMTLNQISVVADQVLAGLLPLPAGYTYVSFAILLEELSLSFSNCTPSFWSTKHLFVSPN